MSGLSRWLMLANQIQAWWTISVPDLTGNTYTIADTDWFVVLDDDDAQVTDTLVVALPAAANSINRILHIKKAGSSHAIQLDANGAETIDGSITYDLDVPQDSVSIMSDGVAWYVM
jgi:hypothetical protein